MENLTLDDASLAQGTPPLGAQGMPTLGAPPPNQQLPPQMFTTAAQLLDLTDKKLMVALRDGRKLIGVLRSWDQFANLVLQSTVERIFIPPPTTSSTSTPGSSPTQQLGLYADIPQGVFLVRGENVLLLGEIDLDKDDDEPPGYERAEPALVQTLNKELKAAENKNEKVRVAKLRQMGFEAEGATEIII